jgi:carbamate kinase
MRIVVALGGNALLRRGEPPEEEVQRRHVVEAAAELADLAREHSLVVCHGNGPQVGLLAVESASDPALRDPYPLNDLSAQTQGMIGYWLVEAMHNAGVRPDPVAVVTRVLVDAQDSAFAAPTKFVGLGYHADEADAASARWGWHMGQDGRTWRRVVPSPRPVAILGLAPIEELLDSGRIVVCGGGGGVPCVRRPDGLLESVEAVVDKDTTAALLAIAIQADAFLVLSDVDGVSADFGTERARRLPAVGPQELAALELPEGSMGPKVAACVAFADATGHLAFIGALGRARDTLTGLAGTTVRPDLPPLWLGAPKGSHLTEA